MKINKIDIDHGEIILIENFFNKEISDQLFNKLLNNVKWQQESMKMFNEEYNFARLTAWYGDKNKDYTFSGITLKPNKWEDCHSILKIKKNLELYTKTIFNSVLLNLYRNGDDYISWHSDNEKELGENPFIASFSFGYERVFRIRMKNNHIEKKDILLPHGSLLIMKGETQHKWQHMIPKKKIKEDLFNNTVTRINLTFRNIVIDK